MTGTTHHGDSADCPMVRAGEWTRCMGHPDDPAPVGEKVCRCGHGFSNHVMEKDAYQHRWPCSGSRRWPCPCENFVERAPSTSREGALEQALRHVQAMLHTGHVQMDPPHECHTRPCDLINAVIIYGGET